MSSPHDAPRARLATLVLTALLVLAVPRLSHAAVFPCTEAGVQAGLASGGVAEITCATTTTIVFTATRSISQGTILDGNGRLILSGGGVRPVLEVQSGVTATVRELVIENGTNAGNYGGNLRVMGNLTVNATTIRGGSSPVGGPGVWVAQTGSMTMNGSTVTGNSGGTEGAVAVHGTATLTNTTVSGNGLRGIGTRHGGNVTLDHCTIVATSNEALYSTGSGTFTVGHSILMSATGGPSVSGNGGTFVSQGYNIITRLSGGLPVQGDYMSNLDDVVPLLGPLADNGGPTLTRALSACSPGIDAGATSVGPTTDQRGAPRAANGACDIGAYESPLRPCVFVDDVVRNEGNSGTVNVTINLRLSGPSAIASQVGYATANGTATTTDGDYTAASGTASFAARATTASFSIPVVGDRRFEPNETVLVQLTSPAGIVVGDAEGVLAITNDDTRPLLSIADSSTEEFDEGVTSMGFVVSLDFASTETVTVAYATLDETAAAPGDYDAASGTLTFVPGMVTRTFTVPIHPDTRFEANERFGVVLSSPMNATFARARATGTLTNDDPMPELVVDHTSLTEGDSGVTEATFTVSLSNPSDAAVSVDFTTAEDSALSGVDFVPTSGQLTFAPGQQIKIVPVSVLADRIFEGTETFRLVLSAPIGATIAHGTGSTTISDDDAMPVAAIADARVTEGHAGSRTLTFLVALDRPSATPIAVPYTTTDGTATLADDDYEVSNGTLTFAPGTTQEAVVVTVNGDARFEGTETLNVGLGTPTGATLGDAAAFGTIDDDDVAPARTISISDVSVSEGDEGTTNAVFTVSLDAAHDTVVTVRFTTSDTTAQAGSDYTHATGTLTFTPGQTSQTITVALTGDTLAEDDETLRVELDMASGATINDGVGVATILDDEASPGLSIGSATITEGESGTRVVEVTVTLSGTSAEYVTVDWATLDDTATLEDDDFASGLGTLVFAPGVTSQTVRVVVVGDGAFEADEQLIVELSNAVGADIATTLGTITLTNDDTEAPMTGDAGVDGGAPMNSGSGCAVGGARGSSANVLAVMLVLAWVCARRRR